MQLVRLVPERIEAHFSGARPRVHHVAWAVPRASVEDLRRELEDRGLPEYLSARLGELDITFHDASASLGHDIEIHVDNQGLRDFFQMVRGGAEGWDGSIPLAPPPPDSGFGVTPIGRSRPRVLVVLREIVDDLVPRSLRADEHVRRRLEGRLVDQ